VVALHGDHQHSLSVLHDRGHEGEITLVTDRRTQENRLFRDMTQRERSYGRAYSRRKGLTGGVR
jgi:hypothetical protein